MRIKKFLDFKLKYIKDLKFQIIRKYGEPRYYDGKEYWFSYWQWSEEVKQSPEILEWQKRDEEEKRIFYQEYKKELQRKRHKYYVDSYREYIARWIKWCFFDIVPETEKEDKWFVTLTFKDYNNEDECYELVRTWIGRLAQSLSYNGSKHTNLRFIMASELQKRGAIHFHILAYASGLGRLSRKRFEFKWQRLSNGFCRIYSAESGVVTYLPKEISKRALIYVGGLLAGLKPPKWIQGMVT